MALTLGNYVIQQLVGGGTTTPVDLSAAKALFVALSIKSDAVPDSLSDSGSNTIGAIPTGGALVAESIFLYTRYVLNPTVSSSHTFTIAHSGTVFAGAIIDTATPTLDASNGANYFDTTADPGSISVAANSIVFAAIAANRSAGSFSAPTGYTLIDFKTYDGSDGGLWVAYNASPSTTEDPTWAATGFQGGASVTSFAPGGVTPSFDWLQPGSPMPAAHRIVTIVPSGQLPGRGLN